MLAYIVAAIAASPGIAAAADEGAAPNPAQPRLEELERDNVRLKRRLDKLEAEATAAAAEPKKEEPASRTDVEAVERENAELRERVEALEAEQEHNEQRLDRLEFFSGRLGGYVDVGFFVVGGDGSGTRPDDQHLYFPEYDTADEWVFMGDPLSTMINSRGDVADTGASQAVDFDPIQSGNNPTFLVNAFNLAPAIGLGKSVAVVGMVDFLPRGRTISEAGAPAIGDYVDVKLAYLRWDTPVKSFSWELYGGKIDGVFGREYRYQEAPDRLTVTPSLMCRYTCGRPVGVSSRMKFLAREALSLNVSLTNGNTHYEAFGTTSERETNVFKTVTGRMSYKFPVGAGLEIGASGLFGAEDLQPRDDVFQWQYGVDVHLDISGFEFTAEFIQGQIDGRSVPTRLMCSEAECLDVLSAYGLVGYRVTNWLMPTFRTDWRDALHQQGGAFVYESELIRFTPGLRFELGQYVVMKAEYTFNVELGRIPPFPNDVFTSSVIARF